MNKNKKNILIGGLLAVVLLLAVGYAAFATTLTINGTSTIDSRWDVHIKDNGIVVDSTQTQAATSNSQQKVNDLTATFNCNLTEPGVSTIDYVVTVENTGTFGAQLTGITVTGATTYIGVSTSKSHLKTNDVIVAGGEDTVTVTVSYNDVSTPPTLDNDRTANITVTLNFVQANGSAVATTTNGGGSEPFVPQYYRYGTNTVSVGDTASTSSWTQDASTLEKNYYLGHDVENGVVTANYACFVLNNTEYCMKSSTDGSTWAENKALLETLKNAGTITCSIFSDSSAKCSGGSVGYLFANSDGAARAGEAFSVSCRATSISGESACYE